MTLNKAQKDREHFLDLMASILLKITPEALEEKDALPEDTKFQEEDQAAYTVPSLGQIVALLNKNSYGTRYDKKWTRQSLKLLLEQLDKKGVKTRIGHTRNKTERANAQRTKNADRHAISTYENYLKHIDIDKKSLNQLAKGLNQRGSRTSKGNLWSAAGCSYLLKRLQKLNLL